MEMCTNGGKVDSIALFQAAAVECANRGLDDDLYPSPVSACMRILTLYYHLDLSPRKRSHDVLAEETLPRKCRGRARILKACGSFVPRRCPNSNIESSLVTLNTGLYRDGFCCARRSSTGCCAKFQQTKKKKASPQSPSVQWHTKPCLT